MKLKINFPTTIWNIIASLPSNNTKLICMRCGLLSLKEEHKKSRY